MKKLGYAVLLIAASAATWWLLQLGFGQIQALRQLERVPNAEAGFVLPGEVTLNATARPLSTASTSLSQRDLSRPQSTASTSLNQGDLSRSLSEVEGTTGSYFTQTPSLFYHYSRERRTTDSEGKTRWQTEFSHTEGVDFLLEDNSGQLPVRIAANPGVVNWSLRQSFSETRGDLRHNEWRVEPGERVFVFGKAVMENQTVVLRFDQPGFYSPILSHYSQADSQASFGGKGIWALWGGLSCVAFALFALARLLSLHRLLVFVCLLAFGQILLLVHLSLTMMHADLRNGLTRYQQQKAAADALAEATFARHGRPWQGWQSVADKSIVDNLPAEDQLRLQAYHRYLGLSQQRLTQQMQARPERWFLSAWQIATPPPVEGLSPEDALAIREQLATLPATRLGGFWPWLAFAAGALVAAILTWMAIRWAKVKRLIENLSHVPTRGVSCGITETGGEILPAADTPLLETPYFHQPCVWYRYLKQERRGSGKNARWVTVDKEVLSQRFYLRDQEGEIPVLAEKAEVISRHHTVKRDGKFRFTETVLKAGDPIYAVAVAAIDPLQPDRLHLRAGDLKEPFILSNFPEKDVMLRKATASMLAICGAVDGLLLSMLIMFGMKGGFSALDFLAAAAVMPAYMIVMMLLLHYNDLIFLRQRALRNWANIDVALKKRKELIDGFARTAKAFLDHERSLQQKLSQLRAALTQTQSNQAKVAEYLRLENQFHQTLSVTIENYPDLKSQALMQKLMTVLSDGETEIALLRQGYNDAATVYNTRIATVPDVVFAKLFHFGRLDLIAG